MTHIHWPPLVAAALVAAAVIYVAFFRKDQFTVYGKKVGVLTVTPAEKAELRRTRDAAEINANRCPDCGASNSLLEGPSGGMSQNILCENCMMEFNVGFGFGTGAFLVDRTGKASASRARIFGVTAEEYAEKVK